MYKCIIHHRFQCFSGRDATYNIVCVTSYSFGDLRCYRIYYVNSWHVWTNRIPRF